VCMCGFSDYFRTKLYESGLKSYFNEFISQSHWIKLAYYTLRIIVIAKVILPHNPLAH
jgi:hypothetical protein